MIQFLNLSSLVLECLGAGAFFADHTFRQAGRLMVAASNSWFAVMPFLAGMPYVWLGAGNAAFCGYFLRSWWRARGKAVAS